MECLAIVVAEHFSKKCSEVSSSSPHAQQTLPEQAEREN